MSSATNWESLYYALKDEYEEFKETSKMIEDELEVANSDLTEKVKKLNKRNELLTSELIKLKERYKQDVIQVEDYNEKLKETITKLEKENSVKYKKVVELEMENTTLDSETRIQSATIESLRKKLDSVMEELILTKTEVEIAKEKEESEAAKTWIMSPKSGSKFGETKDENFDIEMVEQRIGRSCSVPCFDGKLLGGFRRRYGSTFISLIDEPLD